MSAPKLPDIHFFYPGLAEEPAAKEILGGKGHSLAAMSRAGLPVPPGFIIRTECCRQYAEAGRKWPAGLEPQVREALAWLEAQTGRTLGRGPKPLFVAVRSGAAVSMPGMMDTVLNTGMHPSLEGCFEDKVRFWSDLRDFVRSYGTTVCGLDEKLFEREGAPREQAEAFLAAFAKAAGRPFPSDSWEMLVAAVGAVFDSWESERAQRYRARNNIRGLAGSAVTVMAMFPSQQSGILFTADPNRPDSGRIVIEASTGLGEAIVQGDVEPDVYEVDRSSRAIVERRAAEAGRFCLTDAQIVELAELGLKAEGYSKTPVDVEWGFADGRLVLLQSRPVRGLDVARDVPVARREEIERLRAISNGKTVWAMHNLGETLPAPTPLTWDIIGRGFMGRGFVRLYRELGFMPSKRVEEEGFLELIAGRVYSHLGRAAELFFDQFPLEYEVGEDGRAGEMLLDRPTKFDVGRAGPGFLLKLPWYLWRMVAAGRRQRRVNREALQDLEGRVLPAFRAYVAKARAMKLAELPDEAVLAELAERERVALDEFGMELLKPGYVAGYHHGRLAATLDLALGEAEGRALTARLMAGLEGDKTVESNIALDRVARGELTLEAYLEEFGHRAVNELELSEARWREDPSYVRQRVKQLRQAGGVSPGELHERKKVERKAAEASLPEILAKAAAGSLEDEVRADLEGAQRHMPWRETCKHYFLMGVALVREAVEVLAERWDLGKDTYYLRRSELGLWPKEQERLRGEIARRKTRWKAFQRLPLPEVITSADLDAIGREESRGAVQDGVYEGLGVAAGIGTGPVRKLSSPDEAGEMGTGYVLVCPTTDPSWTPLFVHAAGIVVERGGMLSHGAIVARDFGIPAVVLRDATRLLTAGATVKVDGNRGRVEVLEKGL